jgi:hypothetical protein
VKFRHLYPNRAGGLRIEMRDLTSIASVLNRIEDPSALKTVIMSKWERKELTASEAMQLIRKFGLEQA